MIKASSESFFDKVYDVVRRIPQGKVATYGDIAKVVGSPGAARMVGWAMNASHDKPDVPAHRVVNRNGLLTGKAHFAHPDLMQQLLENEGITVIDNQIQDFENKRWIPPFDEEGIAE
ncbi:MGMT family protein [Weeksellaceae bacterium KMM 9713]|uniref:MGMT family protein n=1 Tax=Profundicola chukchiensis TaxID=2961959 RepID=A0A9X4RTZ9_9FLAO|nr:MGMT family protein [Profundicola chukchiensis]MDG4945166.1 MGMT family protein [Profundicola chukchiensis]